MNDSLLLPAFFRKQVSAHLPTSVLLLASLSGCASSELDEHGFPDPFDETDQDNSEPEQERETGASAPTPPSPGPHSPSEAELPDQFAPGLPPAWLQSCDEAQYPILIEDGGRYASIQDAILATPPGGTIFICPGSYNENLDIDHPLSLQGYDPAQTSLDAGNAGPGIIVHGVDFELKGVAVTHGYASLELADGVSGTCGGGLAIEGAGEPFSVRIDNAIFTRNEAQSGGAICNGGASPFADLSLLGVQIFDNRARSYGGGIFSNGSLYLEDTHITANKSDFVGGGVFIELADLTIRRGAFLKNTAAFRSGGLYLRGTSELLSFNTDWGEGQINENLPDDLGCKGQVFTWLGKSASISCKTVQESPCTCENMNTTP